MRHPSMGKRSVKRPPKIALLTGARTIRPRFPQVASAIAAIGVLAAAANARAAANASAATATPAHTGHWCDFPDEPWKEIRGTTINHTGVTLTNVYREKGWASTWHSEPAQAIAPGASDRWCNQAAPFPFTTAAMKTEYALTHGDKVLIEAFIAPFGYHDAKCNIAGPSRSSFQCRVIKHSDGGILSATFELSERLLAGPQIKSADRFGGPLPSRPRVFVGEIAGREPVLEPAA